MTPPLLAPPTCTAPPPSLGGPPTTLPQGPGLWPATPTPPTPISGSHCPFIPTHGTRVDLEGATCSLKLPWQAELVCLAGYLLATLSPKPWLSRTHPHTLVLRHSTGPRPQERGGTQFLGSPAGHSQSCIRSGRWPPPRSHCPASGRSGVLVLSCTAWRWFGAPLQGTGVLRGRPHPSRNGSGDGHIVGLEQGGTLRGSGYFPLGRG